MRNPKIKHSISIALLAIFLSMKLVGLHVLTHTMDKDHAEHCLVCDHALTHNLTPALPYEAPDFDFEILQIALDREVVNHYAYSATGTVPVAQLFGRPPPHLL